MTIPAPNEQPLEYDQPICAGRRWAGVARVEGCEQIFEWQKNKGQGSDGATLNYQGGDLAEPKITFVLWKGWDGLKYVDYFAEWETYRQVFKIPVDPKNPQAIIVEHPQFAHAEIRGVVVKKIGDIKLSPDGRGEVTVEFIVYRKPKPAQGTPKASTTADGSDTDGNSRPKSELDYRIDARAKMLDQSLRELSEP